MSAAARLRVVPAEEFAAAALDAFFESTDGLPSPVVGLATGASPAPLYEALRAVAESGGHDISRIRPFAIDEYVCAPGHKCANRAYFARFWESIPGARRVEQFDPSASELQREAEAVAARLEGAGGLDLAVLGVGLNGHLAFNEPGTARDQGAGVAQLQPETRAAAAKCWGADPPRLGLTLGLAELLGARRVLLLARGAEKAAIVRRLWRGPVGPECTASFVRLHPGAVVLLDQQAASLLDA